MKRISILIIYTIITCCISLNCFEEDDPNTLSFIKNNEYQEYTTSDKFIQNEDGSYEIEFYNDGASIVIILPAPHYVNRTYDDNDVNIADIRAGFVFSYQTLFSFINGDHFVDGFSLTITRWKNNKASGTFSGSLSNAVSSMTIKDGYFSATY